MSKKPAQLSRNSSQSDSYLQRLWSFECESYQTIQQIYCKRLKTYQSKFVLILHRLCAQLIPSHKRAFFFYTPLFLFFFFSFFFCVILLQRYLEDCKIIDTCITEEPLQQKILFPGGWINRWLFNRKRHRQSLIETIRCNTNNNRVLPMHWTDVGVGYQCPRDLLAFKWPTLLLYDF